MSKKHFVMVARVMQEHFRDHGISSKSTKIVDNFAEMFKRENPRFDVDKFKAACYYGL